MVPKPSHRRRVPKRAERNKFSAAVRAQIAERDQGLCQGCKSPGTEIHHVFFKSRGGRGVFTNGVTLCQPCHRKAHEKAVFTDYWINVFVDRYGPNFYKDEYDVK
jgi:5-methylcytosine-specific restriction endonuclease McrA